MSDDFDLRLRNELRALAEAVPVNGPRSTMPHDRSAMVSGLPIVTRVRARPNASLGWGAAVVALVVVVVAGFTVWGRNVVPASSPTAPASHRSGCLVGEAWRNMAEERYQQWDQPAFEKPLSDAGLDYEAVDAKSSTEAQAAQVDQFVAEGAKVIVINPAGGIGHAGQINSAVEKAISAGVAVIAYEDLTVIDNPKVLEVAFDPVEIGRMEARGILAAKPKGAYVIIKGDPQGQPITDLMAQGIHEVLQPAIDRGDIKIVAETYTANWDPNTAMEQMSSILVKNHNQIDAVIAESDGMASGALAALKKVGLAGKVALAGQGGDTWNFNYVAAGTQTVDVWPNPTLLGKTAGEAAVALCKNPDIAKLQGTTLYTSPANNQIPWLRLTPQAITKDNLNVVLDAGWVTKEDVCASLAPSKEPPVCH